MFTKGWYAGLHYFLVTCFISLSRRVVEILFGNHCQVPRKKMAWYDAHLTSEEKASAGKNLFMKLPVTYKFSAVDRAKFKQSKASAHADASCGPVGKFRQQRSNFLIRASLLGNASHVEHILHVGADVNVRNGYGQTPLFCACWKNHATVVELLLAFGADSKIRTNSGISCKEVSSALETLETATTLSTNVEPPIFLLSSPFVCFHTSFCLDEKFLLRLDDAFSKFQGDVIREGSSAFSPRSRSSRPTTITTTTTTITTTTTTTTTAAAAVVAPHGERHTDPQRKFFCDEVGWVTSEIQLALRRSGLTTTDSDPVEIVDVIPYMRFLLYDGPGQSLPPHTDAAKYSIDSSKKSTHTWILFLTGVGDADEDADDADGGGGATLFVEDVVSRPPRILAKCSPMRGRLLVFPHAAPHAGEMTSTTNKKILRGELRMPE